MDEEDFEIAEEDLYLDELSPVCRFIKHHQTIFLGSESIIEEKTSGQLKCLLCRVALLGLEDAESHLGNIWHKTAYLAKHFPTVLEAIKNHRSDGKLSQEDLYDRAVVEVSRANGRKLPRMHLKGFAGGSLVGLPLPVKAIETSSGNAKETVSRYGSYSPFLHSDRNDSSDSDALDVGLPNRRFHNFDADDEIPAKKKKLGLLDNPSTSAEPHRLQSCSQLISKDNQRRQSELFLSQLPSYVYANQKDEYYSLRDPIEQELELGTINTKLLAKQRRPPVGYVTIRAKQQTMGVPIYGDWSPTVMRKIQDKFNFQVKHINLLAQSLVAAGVSLNRKLTLQELEPLNEDVEVEVITELVGKVLQRPFSGAIRKFPVISYSDDDLFGDDMEICEIEKSQPSQSDEVDEVTLDQTLASLARNSSPIRSLFATPSCSKTDLKSSIIPGKPSSSSIRKWNFSEAFVNLRQLLSLKKMLSSMNPNSLHDRSEYRMCQIKFSEIAQLEKLEILVHLCQENGLDPSSSVAELIASSAECQLGHDAADDDVFFQSLYTKIELLKQEQHLLQQQQANLPSNITIGEALCSLDESPLVHERLLKIAKEKIAQQLKLDSLANSNLKDSSSTSPVGLKQRSFNESARIQDNARIQTPTLGDTILDDAPNAATLAASVNAFGTGKSGGWLHKGGSWLDDMLPSTAVPPPTSTKSGSTFGDSLRLESSQSTIGKQLLTIMNDTSSTANAGNQSQIKMLGTTRIGFELLAKVTASSANSISADVTPLVQTLKTSHAHSVVPPLSFMGIMPPPPIFVPPATFVPSVLPAVAVPVLGNVPWPQMSGISNFDRSLIELMPNIVASAPNQAQSKSNAFLSSSSVATNSDQLISWNQCETVTISDDGNENDDDTEIGIDGNTDDTAANADPYFGIVENIDSSSSKRVRKGRVRDRQRSKAFTAVTNDPNHWYAPDNPKHPSNLSAKVDISVPGIAKKSNLNPQNLISVMSEIVDILSSLLTIQCQSVLCSDFVKSFDESTVSAQSTMAVEIEKTFDDEQTVGRFKIRETEPKHGSIDSSDKSVVQDVDQLLEDCIQEIGEPNLGNGSDLGTYRWVQTVEEVEVRVPLKPDTKWEGFAVELLDNVGSQRPRLQIGSDDSPLIDGRLHSAVSSICWYFEDSNTVYVSLTKKNKFANYWDRLFITDQQLDMGSVEPVSRWSRNQITHIRNLLLMMPSKARILLHNLASKDETRAICGVLVKLLKNEKMTLGLPLMMAIRDKLRLFKNNTSISTVAECNTIAVSATTTDAHPSVLTEETPTGTLHLGMDILKLLSQFRAAHISSLKNVSKPQLIGPTSGLTPGELLGLCQAEGGKRNAMCRMLISLPQAYAVLDRLLTEIPGFYQVLYSLITFKSLRIDAKGYQRCLELINQFFESPPNPQPSTKMTDEATSCVSATKSNDKNPSLEQKSSDVWNELYDAEDPGKKGTADVWQDLYAAEDTPDDDANQRDVVSSAARTSLNVVPASVITGIDVVEMEHDDIPADEQLPEMSDENLSKFSEILTSVLPGGKKAAEQHFTQMQQFYGTKLEQIVTVLVAKAEAKLDDAAVEANPLPNLICACEDPQQLLLKMALTSMTSFRLTAAALKDYRIGLKTNMLSGLCDSLTGFGVSVGLRFTGRLPTFEDGERGSGGAAIACHSSGDATKRVLSDKPVPCGSVTPKYFPLSLPNMLKHHSLKDHEWKNKGVALTDWLLAAETLPPNKFRNFMDHRVLTDGVRRTKGDRSLKLGSHQWETFVDVVEEEGVVQRRDPNPYRVLQILYHFWDLDREIEGSCYSKIESPRTVGYARLLHDTAVESLTTRWRYSTAGGNNPSDLLTPLLEILVRTQHDFWYYRYRFNEPVLTMEEYEAILVDLFHQILVDLSAYLCQNQEMIRKADATLWMCFRPDWLLTTRGGAGRKLGNKVVNRTAVSRPYVRAILRRTPFYRYKRYCKAISHVLRAQTALSHRERIVLEKIVLQFDKLEGLRTIFFRNLNDIVYRFGKEWKPDKIDDNICIEIGREQLLLWKKLGVDDPHSSDTLVIVDDDEDEDIAGEAAGKCSTSHHPDNANKTVVKDPNMRPELAWACHQTLPIRAEMSETQFNLRFANSPFTPSSVHGKLEPAFAKLYDQLGLDHWERSISDPSLFVWVTYHNTRMSNIDMELEAIEEGKEGLG